MNLFQNPGIHLRAHEFMSEPQKFISEPMNWFQNPEINLRAYEFILEHISEPRNSCQSPSICFRTCEFISGPMNSFQSPPIHFWGHQFISEPTNSFQAPWIDSRAHFWAHGFISGPVSSSPNTFQSPGIHLRAQELRAFRTRFFLHSLSSGWLELGTLGAKSWERLGDSFCWLQISLFSTFFPMGILAERLLFPPHKSLTPNSPFRCHYSWLGLPLRVIYPA